jgi:hemerythrin-like domain-containing protein
MEAFEQLKRDHLEARLRLVNLGRTYQTALDRAQGLFECVRRHLEIHSQLEQKLLYPALAPVAPEEVDRARREHGELDQLLTHMQNHSMTDPEFSSWVWDLADSVEQHIESEEVGLFAIARERLSPAVLRELDLEMTQLRRALTRTAHL